MQWSLGRGKGTRGGGSQAPAEEDPEAPRRREGVEESYGRAALGPGPAAHRRDGHSPLTHTPRWLWAPCLRPAHRGLREPQPGPAEGAPVVPTHAHRPTSRSRLQNGLSVPNALK